MTTQKIDRALAACGIGSVLLQLAGVVIGAAGGRTFATVTSSPADMAKAVAKPMSATGWTGAYVELLSFGLFLAFAVWACARLGGGVAGAIARSFATTYATLSIVSLGVLDTFAYRSGHGMGLQLASALITLTEALFVCSWFVIAFFLVAVSPLVLASGRRALGIAAPVIAAIILATTAASLDNLGQMSNLLWLAWIVWASVSLMRGEPARRTSTVVAPA
jgi:hypothetical protein